MHTPLTIAAVQMDANPAPTAERLARDEALVAAWLGASAARLGVHLAGSLLLAVGRARSG